MNNTNSYLKPWRGCLQSDAAADEIILRHTHRRTRGAPPLNSFLNIHFHCALGRGWAVMMLPPPRLSSGWLFSGRARWCCCMVVYKAERRRRLRRRRLFQLSHANRKMFPQPIWGSKFTAAARMGWMDGRRTLRRVLTNRKLIFEMSSSLAGWLAGWRRACTQVIHNRSAWTGWI